MVEWFRDCPNLTSVTGLQPVTSYTTNVAGLFRGCPNLDLNNIENISEWDVSGVTNFNYLFTDSIYMTGWEAIETWDVSNGQSFNYTFQNCSLTDTTIQSIKKWNMSGAKELLGTFSKNKNLVNPDFSSWSFPNVENLSNCFSESKFLTLTLPIFPKATNLDNMCRSCSAMTQVNLGGFPSAQNCNGAFQYCGKLKTFDWSCFTTNSLQNINIMFFSSGEIKTMTGMDNLDLSNVRYCERVFDNCKLLTTELDLTSINKNNTGWFSSMYAHCNNLTSVSKLRLFNSLISTNSNISYSPFYGSTITSVSEFDVSFTQSYPNVRNDNLLFTDPQWNDVGFRWFTQCYNLVHIEFTGTFISRDDLVTYPIFKNCGTTKLDSATWQSLANCFPDNTGSGIEKSICIGHAGSSVSEANIALFVNKGYTVYYAS